MQLPLTNYIASGCIVLALLLNVTNLHAWQSDGMIMYQIDGNVYENNSTIKITF